MSEPARPGALGRHLLHLVRRFAAAARRAGPTPQDEAWARSLLTDAEATLWQRHRPGDRRHSVAVARHLAASRAEDRKEEGELPGWLLPAALLHDIGKVDADLPVAGRVVASLLKLLGVRVAPGVLGRYLGYPAHGAALLTAAGSQPEVAAWAAQHHEPPNRWSVPAQWGQLLAAADDHCV
ncbi:MAG: HD domain-containing protein [Acidimicrobiales bacterium]|nr:HD domain-containing protein [Acidimicrobiales bacterium]